MYVVKLNLEDNEIGSNPEYGLYKSIGDTYPELELNSENSTIIKVIAAESREFRNRACATISRNAQPDETYVIFFDRWDINEFISNPYFQQEELEEIQELSSSEALLEKIRNKSGLNFTPETHWVDKSSIDYTGGEVGPNFLLKTIYNSIYFKGEIVLWLHSPEIT